MPHLLFLMTVLLALSPFAPTAGFAQSLDCALVSGAPMLEARLFFGRNIGDTLGVQDEDWVRFVDEEVTPRFPDGLTIEDAAGQWRDATTGRVVREPSKVLTLLIPQDAATLARIRAVADIYKSRFQQDAVGTVLRPSCVDFQ